MSERAAYSRVYWAIVDDPKFSGIYGDDHHLATWLRLLLVADQAHPASAHLPTGTRRASVAALADAGLVDTLPGSRYRIHGLDAERERRRLAATSRPPKDPKRGPNGTRTVPEPNPHGSGTTDLRRDEVETRRDETRQTTATGYPETDSDYDALDVYHELTGYRPWGIWSGDALRGLIADYTDDVVVNALRAEHGLNPERKDLLDRLQARLAREAERAKRDRPKRPARPVIDNDALQRERVALAILPSDEVAS